MLPSCRILQCSHIAGLYIRSDQIILLAVALTECHGGKLRSSCIAQQLTYHE